MSLDENTKLHELNLREKYLFGNCSRHSDTLGIILGLPIAALSKVLVQRRLPTTNPYLVGCLAGFPAFLASYTATSTLYFSYVCWGYATRLLPQDSIFRAKLFAAERKYDTWCVPYNRSRAHYDVMCHEVSVESKWDLTDEFLSREEKHAVQRELRWVPAQDYRLAHRAEEYLKSDERARKLLVHHERLRKGFFSTNHPD
ncbi:hypothetical protein ACHWQZ_G009698 [Mnemiopsis leidyi]